MEMAKNGSMAKRLCVLITFAIFLGIVNSAQNENQTICTTRECSDFAGHIVQYMNKDISPCENFYQFVCGNYEGDDYKNGDVGFYAENHCDNYDENYGDDSVWENSIDFVKSMTIKILETKSSEEQNKPFLQAFDLFEACSNQDAMREQGLTPLQEILDKIGGWPIVVGPQWEEMRWEDAAGTLTELGYDSGIFFNVQIMSTDGLTIQLTPTEIEEFDSETWEKLTVVAKKLGANPDDLMPSSSDDHFHSFDENPSNMTVHLTIEEMSKRWPSIDWMTYLTGIFAAVPTITVTENQNVIAPPEYIDKLVEALEKYEPSSVMNYVSCKLVDYSLQYLSPDVVVESGSDKNVDQSPTQNRAHCAGLVTRELPLIVEAIYEVNYVTDNLRQVTLELSSELKKEFNKQISQAEWIDTESKEVCKKKLQDMKFALGYPEDIENGFYTQDYRGLEIDKNSYLHSMLNINKFRTSAQYEKSIENDKTGDDDGDNDDGGSEDEDYDGRLKITSLNVQYDSEKNTISIMPGILHDPFINEKLPMYVNYGGLGFVVGHEIIHGYDTEDKIFAANDSSSHNAQERGREQFRSDSRCMDKQYEEYIMDTWQLKVDGSKWSAENIADDGGVKMAFYAYQEWANNEGTEPALPGLDYTPLQSFWIAFAHVNCGKYNPHRKSELVQIDNHGLHEFRVNSPLANSDEFAETFNCPLGSSMNPEKKCTVW